LKFPELRKDDIEGQVFWKTFTDKLWFRRSLNVKKN